jgi:hypothetical protein
MTSFQLVIAIPPAFPAAKPLVTTQIGALPSGFVTTAL